MTVYVLNSAINLVIALAVVVLSITACRRGVFPWYLTVALVVIGLGWAVLYVYVLFFNNSAASLVLGRIFIRPLVTLTLGSVVAAIIHWVKNDS